MRLVSHRRWNEQRGVPGESRKSLPPARSAVSPMCVATFWAQCSAHRLMKKRKRSDCDDETTLNPEGGVHHQGSHLTAGTWILYQRTPTGPTKLARVRYASKCAEHSDDAIRLHLHAFGPDVIQEDEEGGEYAESSSLIEGRKVVIDLASICLTVLLAVEFRGRMWFVEQP